MGKTSRRKWQQIHAYLQQNRLPQGLVLHGPEGLGQLEFALQLAATLLCLSPKQLQPCGECRACHLQQSENHPDFCCLTPSKEGGIISVDSVRGVIHTLAHSQFVDHHRVVVIAPATAMNEQAQNALLKSLEEPPTKTIFILVCDALGRLKPTILSRCQKIVFSPVWKDQKTLQFLQTRFPKENPVHLLQQAGGAPLLCDKWSEAEHQKKWHSFCELLQQLLQGKQSLIATASALQIIELPQFIAWLALVCEDALYRLFDAPEQKIQHPELIPLLIAHNPKPSHYHHLIAWLTELRQKTRHNLNSQIVTEDLLIRLMHGGQHEH